MNKNAQKRLCLREMRLYIHWSKAKTLSKRTV